MAKCCYAQAYKYEEISESEIMKSLSATNVNLKVLPGVNWQPEIAQLVAYNLQPMKVMHLLRQLTMPLPKLQLH